jgi:hypothetical protein
MSQMTIAVFSGAQWSAFSFTSGVAPAGELVLDRAVRLRSSAEACANAATTSQTATQIRCVFGNRELELFMAAS